MSSLRFKRVLYRKRTWNQRARPQQRGAVEVDRIGRAETSSRARQGPRRNDAASRFLRRAAATVRACVWSTTDTRTRPVPDLKDRLSNLARSSCEPLRPDAKSNKSINYGRVDGGGGVTWRARSPRRMTTGGVLGTGTFIFFSLHSYVSVSRSADDRRPQVRESDEPRFHHD